FVEAIVGGKVGIFVDAERGLLLELLPVSMRPVDCDALEHRPGQAEVVFVLQALGELEQILRTSSLTSKDSLCCLDVVFDRHGVLLKWTPPARTDARCRKSVFQWMRGV